MRAEPWPVAHLRRAQLAGAALVVALPLGGMAFGYKPSPDELPMLPIQLLGVALGIGTILSPLLLFLPLGARASEAFRTAPRWASIGRVAGCYFAILGGIALMIWTLRSIVHDRSSTAALAIFAVPFLWVPLGLIGYLLCWGVGLILERERPR